MQNYHRELEKRLDCSTRIDALHGEFQDFLKANHSPDSRTETTLRQIKLFLHENKDSREKTHKGTVMGGVDCLTFSTLAALLAKREGHDVFVASPKKLTRVLHALVTYREGDAMKTFTIAGRTRFTNVHILSPKQVSTRLAISGPVMRLGTRVAEKLKLRKT